MFNNHIGILTNAAFCFVFVVKFLNTKLGLLFDNPLNVFSYSPNESITTKLAFLGNGCFLNKDWIKVANPQDLPLPLLPKIAKWLLNKLFNFPPTLISG